MANPQIANFDTSKLFLGRNYYDTATYTNSSGSEVTISAGRLLGRVGSSNLIALQDKDNTNGSQIPLGVSADTYVVANGASATITYAIAGRVASELLGFASGETLATVVNYIGTDGSSPAGVATVPAGTIKDVMQRSGFQIITSTELTAIDNPQS
jgi:hypothetical protein